MRVSRRRTRAGGHGWRTVATRQPGFVAARTHSHGGTGWPDALAGTFVRAAPGGTIHYRAPVPDGAVTGRRRVTAAPSG